jgi:hypothetical protein
MLGMTVAALLLLMGGYFVVTQIDTALDYRRRQNGELRGRVQRLAQTVQQGAQADRRLRQLEQRSLPRDREVAGSLYRSWLLDTVQKVGLTDPNVSATSGLSHGDVYDRLTFSVSGQADIEQLVELLHEFYSVNDLHQIRRLRVKPTADPRVLDISLTIEALVLPGAVREGAVANVPAEPLAFGALEQYSDMIVRRNIFGPPNKPPVLSGLSEKRVELGRAVSFTARAKDPDERDRVRFRLGDDAPPDASIGETSGEFRWTPEQLGAYTVTVHVTDDGMPNKSDSDSFKITVVEPAPPPDPVQVVERPKLSFDDAKHAYVSGITSNAAGQWELWLTIRTTGQVLRLKEGDRLSVGSIDGVVSRIRERDVVVETDDRKLLVSKGENLLEGQELPAEDI